MKLFFGTKHLGLIGFVFTPSAHAESLPGKDNAVCMTVLKTLRLEITYLGKEELFP